MKSTEEMVSEAQRVMGQGYQKLKIKVGAPDYSEDVEHAFAVRKAIGEDASFRIDANAGLTFDRVLNLLRLLTEVHLEIVEQPLPIWDYDGLARLSTLIDIPIMADESCHSLHSAMELVKRQAVAIFDIKLMKNGGIHNSRKIAAIAQSANIPIYAGGNVGSSVGAAAAAHFYAATPNVIAGDFNLGPGGWLTADLVEEPLHVEGPFAFVPDGAGIGVQLDEKKLNRYAVSA
jgi:muconate cycloisomerase